MMSWNRPDGTLETRETELYGGRAAHRAMRNWDTAESEIKQKYYIH